MQPPDTRRYGPVRATSRVLPSVLEEAEVRAGKDRLRRLEALLLLGARFLDRRVLGDQEVAGLVEVVDLVLQNLQLALLRALRLLQLLQFRRLLCLFALFRDEASNHPRVSWPHR